MVDASIVLIEYKNINCIHPIKEKKWCAEILLTITYWLAKLMVILTKMYQYFVNYTDGPDNVKRLLKTDFNSLILCLLENCD